MSTRDLIGESSVGRSAWCGRCGHPVDLHGDDLACYAPLEPYELESDPTADAVPLNCSCSRFRPMTVAQWRRFKAPDL